MTIKLATKMPYGGYPSLYCFLYYDYMGFYS